MTTQLTVFPSLSTRILQTLIDEAYRPNASEWLFITYIGSLPAKTVYYYNRANAQSVLLRYSSERSRGRLLLNKLSPHFCAIVERAVTEYSFASDGALV